MSIDWVPLLNVPMHRRLELIAAGLHMLLLLFGQLICMTAFVFLLVKIHHNLICRFDIDFLPMQEANENNINRTSSSLQLAFTNFIFCCSWTAIQSSVQRVLCTWCSCTTIDMQATLVAAEPGNATDLFICSFILRYHLSLQLLCVHSSEWVRNWVIWKYFVNYFPVDLVKTVDLPADRHYLFAVFPHGIIGWILQLQFSVWGFARN